MLDSYHDWTIRGWFCESTETWNFEINFIILSTVKVQEHLYWYNNPMAESSAV